MSAAKERPVLFAGSMVRALLEDRKGQTRRVMKEQPTANGPFWFGMGCSWAAGEQLPGLLAQCPYGQPGDRLVVRETWRTAKSLDAMSPVQIAKKATEAGYNEPWAPIKYEADGHEVNWSREWGNWGKTRVSIHMPRWASRLTLEVTEVKVDFGPVSLDDAIKEGFSSPEEFAALYEKINGAGSLNLWRWAVSFRRLP
jgi:hypothetical protein